MANKNLFKNTIEVPVTDAVNAAGGAAYQLTPKNTLAQIAATNCFNGTYYVDAETNLKIAKDAVAQLKHDPKFIAQVALYSREKAFLKDMPAFLVCYLATLDAPLFRKVFPKIIDNGKMLRNFVQIGRSGAVGKKLCMTTSSIRRSLQNWFANRTPESLLRATIGNDPSLRDILRLCRPCPSNDEQAALFAYLKEAEVVDGELITRNKDKSVKYRHSVQSLPEFIRNFENFKRTHEGEIPNVDFRLLDSTLTKDEARKLWAAQARNGAWAFTRMNLNNFQKYGVFNDSELVDIVAKRLADKELIAKARAFPYQLMMAYNAATEVPHAIREALQDAMEHAISNVPALKGQVYICVDTSGSMGSPVTGNRGTATSAVRCVDVAGLFASAALRNNPSAQVLPFDTSVHRIELNPRDTVLTNAKKLARNGGGTDCSCAVRDLNSKRAKGDAIIFISDNESWVDGGSSYTWGRSHGKGTLLMEEWLIFKKRNPDARMVCIDLTPNPTSQVTQHADILQVGGWSDEVWNVVARFIEAGHDAEHWVKEIEAIEV